MNTERFPSALASRDPGCDRLPSDAPDVRTRRTGSEHREHSVRWSAWVDDVPPRRIRRGAAAAPDRRARRFWLPSHEPSPNADERSTDERAGSRDEHESHHEPPSM